MMFKVIIALLTLVAITIVSPFAALAAPYGAGLYNANVPYGGETELSIATSGNVSAHLTPNGGETSVSGSGTVTVTTSDVMGYKLYIRGLSTSTLVSGSNAIPASSNVLPAALVVNSWGYSFDNGTTYTGLTTGDVLIRTTTGPDTSGDVSTITYGAKVDNQTAAGSYSVNIIYTAVPQTD